MSITVVYKNSGIHTFDLVDKAYTDDNGNYVLEWLKYSYKIVKEERSVDERCSSWKLAVTVPLSVTKKPTKILTQQRGKCGKS